MYRNKYSARYQDHSKNGKYNNFFPTTTRHRPHESSNSIGYDKSNRVGLFKNNKTNKNSYSETSTNEGPDFGNLSRLWEKLATCESRLEMMGRMLKRNIGFNETEDFVNRIEKKITDRDSIRGVNRRTQKLKETTMTIKISDERKRHSKLVREKNAAKRMVIEKSEGDREKVRKILRKLRKVGKRKKRELREKNNRKIEHLVKKQNEREEKNKIWRMEGITTEVRELQETSAFREEKFDNISEEKTETCTVGGVEIDECEKELLKLHPKFAVRTKLDREQFELDLECGFAKLRWEIGKDEEEEKSSNVGEKADKEQRVESIEEEEMVTARNEMVFDPIEKEYDARKMKVTNLAENTRITLPKPLKPIHEAEIEIRRKEYIKVYEKYRKEETNRGVQEPNMTEKEEKGLKSIKKRVEEGDIVVIKTDKSSKLAVMNTEEYLDMGRGTRTKDRKVDRKKIVEVEKKLNEQDFSRKC